MEEPSVLVGAKAGKLSDMVDGTAPVGHSAGATMQPDVATVAQRPKRAGDSPPQTERMPKQHRVSGGRFTRNRSNEPLCEACQRGACQAHPRNPIYCPVNRSAVHQCC